MAPRIRKIRHDDETRAKIQTSQLINRLTEHALGNLSLEPTQVRSIEILLKKTLPDLTATELSGGIEIATHEEALNELDEPGTDDQA